MATKNTIEFVGKLFTYKESDKFKPYEEKVYDSGWVNRTAKFGIACGNDRHMMVIKGGKWQDDAKMNVKTYTKPMYDDNNNLVAKSESITIPWDERFKKEQIMKVAEYRKFIVDLEVPERRRKLESAVEKFKDGSMTDEEMSALGVNTLEEAEKAVKDSHAKRKEFITEWDFAEYMNKVASNEKMKDKIVKIRGEYHIEYNVKTQQFYRSFIPSRVYLCKDNEPTKSEATFDFYFNKDAVDDNDFAEKKKYHINGFLRFYDSTYEDNKGEFGCPIMLTIDGNQTYKNSKGDTVDGEKFAKGMARKFEFTDTDNEFRQIGLKVNVLDGAQTVAFDESMLTDEQREDIELGLVTLEDIKKEMGVNIYGDRVTDIVIMGIAQGYSKGAIDSAFVASDFLAPHPAGETEDEADDDVIFNEDDIDI